MVSKDGSLLKSPRSRTALATSSTVRGGCTSRLNEDPRLASQDSKAMGKVPSFWYLEMLTLSFRLLSLLPSISTSKPRWEKIGGCQPNASYSAMCFGVEMSHSCILRQCHVSDEKQIL